MALSQLRALFETDPATLGSHAHIQSYFESLAANLTSNFVLVSGKNKYRLAEIEFYLHADCHEDVFSHRSGDQLTCGKFYFHKSGNTYKGGTYKGLDLTFGNNCFGGILLRAMTDVSTSAYIEGSCMVANRLLEDNHESTVFDLVSRSDFNWSIWEQKSILHLEAEAEACSLVASPRVGLTLKQRDGERVYYIMKPYRFVADAKKVKKGKPTLLLQLYANGNTKEEVAKATRTREDIANRYIESFENGRKRRKKTEALITSNGSKKSSSSKKTSSKPATTKKSIEVAKEAAVPFVGRALKTADLCELMGIIV